MANFRIYRRIYRVNYNAGTTNYTLIDPVSIIASVYLSNVIVESTVVTNESTGVYYAELTPTLYTNPNIYELRWTVQYTSDSSSVKNLRTFFTNESFDLNINQLYVFGEIDYEVDDNFISYEIQEQFDLNVSQLYVFGEIDHEVDDNFISYEIQEQSEIILETLKNP